jgi:Zn-dependent peptidase ImmA (M78 family)
MKYQTTILEDWIKEFFYKIDIYHPRQLDFLDIAARLGISVEFQKFSSRVYKGEIIIDERISPAEQWEDFSHELCHILRQEGNQLVMSDTLLLIQEAKAENFSLHFCVPTFMLLNYEISNYLNINDGIPFVVEKFNVTKEFAKKRLIHFRNQIQLSKSDQEFRGYMNSFYPKTDPEKWTDETKRILSQLNKQLNRRKKVVI